MEFLKDSELPAGAHEGERALLHRKLRWMTFARLAVFVFLGGATAVFGVDTFHPKEARIVVGPYNPVDATDVLLFFAAGAGCLLTLIYAFGLRVIRSYRNLQRLAHVQVFGDALFAGLMVLLTGGTTSSFGFFFSIVIIEGAIITYRTGAFYTATFCTLLFVGIGLAEVFMLDQVNMLSEHVTRPASHVDTAAAWGGLTYRVLNSIVAFYSIAFMSSYLAERLRTSAQELELNRLSLQELRVFYENIVASIPVGVITLDPDGVISFVNARAQRITGLAPSTSLNGRIEELLPDVSPLLEGRQAENSLFLSAHGGDGTVRDQAWSMAPLRNRKDHIIGHLLAVEDVTDSRELERKVQRSERYATLGRLAATIAHDIRNPLTAIAGSIQLLSQDETRTDQDKRLMAIVARETDALNRWITDFLTYARPISESRSRLNLAREVSEAMLVLENDARTKDIELKSTVPASAMAMADAGAVKQIIWNLLINAIEAMPDGGKLWVELDTTTLEQFVQLRITDTGTGIKEEDAESIFAPFVTTKEGGTGLGLATCFRLARELKGKLDFHSLLGEGTTFYLDLPKALGDASGQEEGVAGVELSDEDRHTFETEKAAREKAARRTGEQAIPMAASRGGSTGEAG